MYLAQDSGAEKAQLLVAGTSDGSARQHEAGELHPREVVPFCSRPDKPLRPESERHDEAQPVEERRRLLAR